MFHILGFIVSRDSYMNIWEVILPAGEGKLEVSYRWFRYCKDAEVCCFKEANGETGLSTILNKQLDI